jgi:hypothetical protein
MQHLYSSFQKRMDPNDWYKTTERSTKSTSPTVFIYKTSDTPLEYAEHKEHVTQPHTPADDRILINPKPDLTAANAALTSESARDTARARITEQLLPIIKSLANKEKQKPPAFGTPTEATEPSPDTIL